MNKKIIFNKEYLADEINELDAYDIIHTDDIVTDIFGNIHGKFIVQVQYIEPDYIVDDE